LLGQSIIAAGRQAGNMLGICVGFVAGTAGASLKETP
jgi:hypothetical protein